MYKYKSSEDYLEAILMVQKEKGSCRSIDVAIHLGFSKPSVSIAMGKLQNQGLIVKQEDGHLELTEEGRKLAQKVLDKHLVLTGFLKQIGVSADVAEEDACLLEHSLSNESFEKLRLWMEQQKKDGDK